MTRNPPQLRQTFASNDFKRLLGTDWGKLHPDIQKRFSLDHCHRTTVYQGVMHEVEMSFAGRLLAYFCRLLGTPLSYGAGKNVPTVVRVYPNEKLGGTTWDRFYHFNNNRLNRVRSTKVILVDRRLIEVASSGFGMYSRVYAQRGALMFASKRFFFTLGRWRIPIPHLLSPGETVAGQRALSDGRFEFTLHIQHKILGTVFKQRGIFREIIDERM